MDVKERSYRRAGECEEEIMDVRKGPWTDEEDAALMNYITLNGEGHWNTLARSAGLNRTGKSCRLRWLNYLRPDVRRGNITLQEQLLILELHSRWGNRWSKIAQHLPGRTDNEIKNYWRTRVQKQAKQLKCDVNSKQFRDTMRYLWMPRLAERILAGSESKSSVARPTTITTSNPNEMGMDRVLNTGSDYQTGFGQSGPDLKPEMSAGSSDSVETQISPVSDLTDCNGPLGGNYMGSFAYGSGHCPDFGDGPSGINFQAFEQNNGWMVYGDSIENTLNEDDIQFLQQQLNFEV